VRVFQSGQLGAIRVYKRARPKDAPHPIHDPEDEYRMHQRKDRIEGHEGYEGHEGHEGRRG
jgi:hypothetical protein